MRTFDQWSVVVMDFTGFRMFQLFGKRSARSELGASSLGYAFLAVAVMVVMIPSVKQAEVETAARYCEAGYHLGGGTHGTLPGPSANPFSNDPAPSGDLLRDHCNQIFVQVGRDYNEIAALYEPSGGDGNTED